MHDILSVSELNRKARGLLEGSFSIVWVEGEISNLARPASGHLYFSLKDAQAQVRCAMFRPRASLLEFIPANGMQVTARAKVSLYEPRGDFQLLVEHLEETGSGALQRAFEALKKRLLAEGLFDPARKRPLPALPACIGVITSPSGAVIRDILSVLRRRFAAIPVLLYPVPVQGKDAPAAIVQALRAANEQAECDVLIVARGGGSLEDLWAFNDEQVARAIAASTIPVVSAVGHEVDVTIADFVADQRAPTPSAAAEMLSPDGAAWQQHLARLAYRLAGKMRQLLELKRQRLDWLEKRLPHPRQRLRTLAQRLDDNEARLARALDFSLRRAHQRLQGLETRLAAHSPRQKLETLRLRLRYLENRLPAAWQPYPRAERARLETLARALNAVSPLQTLARGYAIVSDAESGQILHCAGEAGERIQARLAEGSLLCRVEEKIMPPPAEQA